ncbi:MAG TPA: hypothetical protein VGQ35_20915 [Dongiaceae bacterium]|jgi:outer membrane protein assembly factor BamB|nr:hypothetical protein [Dongiaceae bacterium]
MLRTVISSARLVLCCAIAAGAFWTWDAAAYSWERPHSVGSNSGFFDTRSIPARTPLKAVPGLGSIAAGAGPVIEADGTVVIGNQEGKLMTFRPDGTPWWSRDLPGQMILASPVIDSEGSIYVVGVQNYTDHRVAPPVKVQKSILHKFTAGGGWLYQTPFPEHYKGAVTSAAPNIWKSGGAEVIMVPIAYPNTVGGGYETHLVAFSTTGQVIGDAKVGYASPTVTGGPGFDWGDILDLLPPYGFSSPAAPARKFLWPQPTAALFTYAGGGTPFIIVADGFQDLVGFTFSGMVFQEIFRVHDEADLRVIGSTPMVTPDGHTVFGTPAGIRFAGPNMNPVATIKDIQTMTAPTQLADGKIAIATNNWQLAILQGGTVETRISLGSDASMASPAATRMHIFVSTQDALVTYDATTLQEVARFNWQGGGLWPPVIGPQGNIYAIVGSQLYVFPGPGQDNVASTGSATAPATPVTDAPPQTAPAEPEQPAQSSKQSFKPPLTANGNRLFACESPDSDDCGKGDAKAIAQAFCQKQGFTRADDIDTDSKKVKAETLDGQLCSKKKCRVFDKIVCKM